MTRIAHRLLYITCKVLLAMAFVYSALTWPAAGDWLDGMMRWHEERA